jgi:HEPN domain-containing protein
MQSANMAQILLLKGKQDQYVVNRFSEDRSIPDETIGFHAQQAVEKMLKAVLAHRAITYRRTHQLEGLVALPQDAGIPFPPELSEAVALTPYAVELRYDLLPIDDDAAAPFDRQWAKRCVERIAEWASSVVGEKEE